VRHEAYEAYKATRTKTDDALVTQIEGSRRIFKAFGIPLYERSGFEADDILGTIAHLLKNDTDVEVIIASGDMDTLQLIDGERVKVYTLKKGINDTILYDAEAVMERFGFPPERIPDYKGLRGDPSDNIKGVPGIGDKTATDLVVRFGSIDDIYNTLKKGESAFLDAGIKARTIRLLKEHEEDARFSTMIATIRTDAPIAFRLEDTRFHDGTTLPGILALFDELGFRSLRARAKNVLGETGETGEEEMEAEPTLLSETVSDERLEEARVMLWLLASDFTNPSLDDILAYAREDSFDAAYEVLQKKLKETGRLFEVYEKIEQPLIPILKEMKMHGVLVDKKMLDTLSKTYGKELETIEARIVKAAGREFNISSPKQLGEVLFDELGLSVKGQKKTSTGQRSTRESELEKLQDLHPIVADVLEYREVQKLLSTYIEALPPLLDSENRLHADFIQTGTTTGRMASANPNLQNIPIRTERGRLIRNAFIAPRGFRLVALDYSQIELRLAAILSKDEKLCEIFKSGRDVHKEVAARVFKVRPEEVDAEMRRRAKAINFGILYGMGANALRVSLNSTMAEAHEYLEGYFNTFKTLSAYIETTKGFARKHGYTETMFGRRREFPGIRSPLPYVRAQAERMAINAPMQGTQSDIIKLAMVRIDEHLRTTGKRDEAHLLLQVHDELVYELHEEHSEALAKDIKQIMESVVSLKETGGVPIIVEAKEGANWGEMAPLAL
jgi:DNA polymerase-1